MVFSKYKNNINITKLLSCLCLSLIFCLTPSLMHAKKDVKKKCKHHSSSSSKKSKKCCVVKKCKNECPSCQTKGPVCARAEQIAFIPLQNQGQINITVLRTGRFPGDQHESLIFAELEGKVWKVNLTTKQQDLILDISDLVLTQNRGENGLVGLELDPCFSVNGTMYLTYALEGSRATPQDFDIPNVCEPSTLNQVWDYENFWNHTNVVEEWKYAPGSTFGDFEKVRRFLEIKSISSAHQGIDSLRWDKEQSGLIYVLGETGPGFVVSPPDFDFFLVADIFNVSQNKNHFQGKHLLLDVNGWPNYMPTPVATFSELPVSVNNSITMLASGFRNGNAPAAEKCNKRFIRYSTMQGASTLESIFAFDHYGLNFGWRPLEGGTTPTLTNTYEFCESGESVLLPPYLAELKNATLWTDTYRPVESQLYETQEPWPRAQIGAIPYKGNKIPELQNSVITAWFRTRIEANGPQLPGRLRYFCPNKECLQEKVPSFDLELEGIVNDGMLNAIIADGGNRFTAIGANDDFTEVFMAGSIVYVTDDQNRDFAGVELRVYQLQPLN